MRNRRRSRENGEARALSRFFDSSAKQRWNDEARCDIFALKLKFRYICFTRRILKKRIESSENFETFLDIELAANFSNCSRVEDDRETLDQMEPNWTGSNGNNRTETETSF